MGKSPEKLTCVQCEGQTNHDLLSSYRSSYGSEDEIFGGTTHDFLKCRGCDSSTLRLSLWCSVDDPREGPEIRLYPTRERFRKKTPIRMPKQFADLPYGGPIESVYRQTVSAFSGDLLILAGAGVRLLIEGICKDCGVEGGTVVENDKSVNKTNLQGKINGMVKKGFISENQAEILHEIRFLGNDATHELYQPPKEIVETALDIVEHILIQVYDQPEKLKVLSNRTRPSKKPSDGTA